jgi:hypothetical protein
MSTYVAVCPVMYNACLMGAIAGMAQGKSSGAIISTDAGLVANVAVAQAFAQEMDTNGYTGGVATPGTAPDKVLATAGATVPPTTAALANALGWAPGAMACLCAAFWAGRSSGDSTAADYLTMAKNVAAAWSAAANLAANISLL